MKLNRNQKKFIRKHKSDLSIQEMADHLDMSPDEVRSALTGHETIDTVRDGPKFPAIPPYLPIVILCVLIFLAYANGLNNEFVSDDIPGIVNYPHVGDFSVIFKEGLAAGFISVRFIIVGIIYNLFHLQPAAYRLVNIFFHTGSTVLVYLLGKKLYNQKVGFIAALLFSVHPVVVESVTWIIGGAYAQYGFFVLAAFYTYLKGRTVRKWYALSLLLFLLALSSSEKAMPFALVPISYELLVGDLRKNWKKAIGYFIPTLLRVWTSIQFVTPRVAGVEAGSVGHSAWENPIIQFPFSISSYLELFFFPKTLTIYHAKELISTQELTVRWIATIAFFVTLAFIYTRSRKAFFWCLFFVISLLPFLTPLRIAWTVAERYMYLSTAGLSIAVALGINGLLKYRGLRPYVYGAVVIIVLAFAGRTIIRNFDWKSEDTFKVATARVSAESALIHYNLGTMYTEHKQIDKAEAEFKKSLKINPLFANASNHLAQINLDRGNLDEGLKYYQQVVAHGKPDWKIYYNIAFIYFQKENYVLAEQNLLKAIELNPQDPNLHRIMTLIYTKTNNMEKLKEEIIKAGMVKKK